METGKNDMQMNIWLTAFLKEERVGDTPKQKHAPNVSG